MDEVVSVGVKFASLLEKFEIWYFPNQQLPLHTIPYIYLVAS